MRLDVTRPIIRSFVQDKITNLLVNGAKSAWHTYPYYMFIRKMAEAC